MHYNLRRCNNSVERSLSLYCSLVGQWVTSDCQCAFKCFWAMLYWVDYYSPEIDYNILLSAHILLLQLNANPKHIPVWMHLLLAHIDVHCHTFPFILSHWHLLCQLKSVIATTEVNQQFCYSCILCYSSPLPLEMWMSEKRSMTTTTISPKNQSLTMEVNSLNCISHSVSFCSETWYLYKQVHSYIKLIPLLQVAHFHVALHKVQISTCSSYEYYLLYDAVSLSRISSVFFQCNYCRNIIICIVSFLLQNMDTWLRYMISLLT